MIARAPGKVVLSGAYAVLEGAPAIVAAVDRYVVADATRRGDFMTPEVRAAIGEEPPPWFDASALRNDGRKLGLGSSAAILVASLAARHVAHGGASDDASLRDAVFTTAVEAHRRAQGGGSGIDVASSAWGGVILAWRGADGLAVESARLPRLHVEVWACPDAASTSDFLRKVEQLARRDPSGHRRLLDHLGAAAERAAIAVRAADPASMLEALGAQRDGLDALGQAAGIPIFTDAVRELATLARDEAVLMPAGAGGGDICSYFGSAPPSKRLLDAARSAALTPLNLSIGTRGVHLAHPGHPATDQEQ